MSVWMGLHRSLSHHHESHQQQSWHFPAPWPALPTQHILTTLVKVFQRYCEHHVPELFYFCYLQCNTEHCVTADHYFRFPWLLALSLMCTQFYSNFVPLFFQTLLLYLLYLPRTKQLFHSTCKQYLHYHLLVYLTLRGRCHIIS